MLAFFILTAALCIAYANGANANPKGVASLVGSGTCSYHTALRWGTAATLAGSLLSLYWGSSLAAIFTGKGLIPAQLAGEPLFLFSAAAGAAVANMLASGMGYPVSTTHLLLGGLLGPGLLVARSSIQLETLWASFVLPLLLSPLAAVLLGALLYLLLRALKLVPEQRSKALDTAHYLSGGAVSLARGLNDTPKMAALVAGTSIVSMDSALLLIAGSIAVGGLWGSRAVTHTLAHKITDMSPAQGFVANLSTAALVILGSSKGLPLSTTHVSVGALLGIGILTRQAKWRSILPILSAWVILLPVTALISALLYALGQKLVGIR
jgi:inorganic phosphate transporter, PiT family